MKYLKIENGQGFFLLVQPSEGEEEKWELIDRINKVDLMNLLEKAISELDFEMDVYNEALLQNKAHQIIYENIYEKFTDLLSNKTKFRDECENMYKSALKKYSNTSEDDCSDLF